MPIRFRCAFCNQLMGIARRKAGTVVSCPKCTGQVVVPNPIGPDDNDADQLLPEFISPQNGKNGLFEHSDFGEIFEDSPASGPQVQQPPSSSQVGVTKPPLPKPMVPEFEAVPLRPVKAPSRGIYLTTSLLVVVSALVVVLMGMAFFLGLLLGRS